MEFCNKGMVRADTPPPPVMVKDHKITILFGTLPLVNMLTIIQSLVGVIDFEVGCIVS